MEPQPKLSVRKTSRSKFVRPMLDPSSAQSTRFSQQTTSSKLTLSNILDFGRTKSSKDIVMKRSSKEYDASDSKLKVKINDDKIFEDDDQKTKNIFYPNTKMAMENHQSLFELADEFVKTLFNASFKKLYQKPKDAWRKTKERNLPRKLFTNLLTIHYRNPDVFRSAVDLVDDIIEECNRRLFSLNELGIDRFKAYRSADEFCMSDGVEVVLACLGRWILNPLWCVKVLYAGRSVGLSHSYHYTVRLSVPTLAYPVAQVTVDVHFTVVVTPARPLPLLLEVWFRLETHRSQHLALGTVFREDWLNVIVDRKLQAFQMFKF